MRGKNSSYAEIRTHASQILVGRYCQLSNEPHFGNEALLSPVGIWSKFVTKRSWRWNECATIVTTYPDYNGTALQTGNRLFCTHHIVVHRLATTQMLHLAQTPRCPVKKKFQEKKNMKSKVIIWQLVNILTTVSDQNTISFHNIYTKSSRQVMRIKKSINHGIITWFNAKFSELTS